MIVQDLSSSELSRQLCGDGIWLRTGPVVYRIRSAMPTVAAGIGMHYALHSVESPASFADFHVDVSLPRSVRRWFHPQVVFRFDGESPFAPLPAAQAFPLLEWGLNWCIYTYCHQFVTLHSAVLERGGRALILPAPSGSGKSTLCAGLAFSGWRLLSDELTPIDPDRGEVVAVPRPISLKNQSIPVIRAFAPEAVFSPAVPDTVKGSVAHVRAPIGTVERASERAVPAWVVLPKYKAGAPARLLPVSKAHLFMSLVNNTFNYSVHGARAFGTLAELVDRCDCFEFEYSSLDEAVAIFDRLANGEGDASA